MLEPLETIQIPSQVNTKQQHQQQQQQQQQEKNKQTKENAYTLRGYLMPSKLGETLMSH